jgi:hypothetical protein
VTTFPNITVHVVSEKIPTTVEKAIKNVVSELDLLDIPKRVATEKALRDYYTATLEAVKNSEGIDLYPLLIPGMWAVQIGSSIAETRRMLDSCGFDYGSYQSNKETTRVLEASQAIESIPNLPQRLIADFYHVVIQEVGDEFLSWILEHLKEPHIVIALPLLVTGLYTKSFRGAMKAFEKDSAPLSLNENQRRIAAQRELFG